MNLFVGQMFEDEFQTFCKEEYDTVDFKGDKTDVVIPEGMSDVKFCVGVNASIITVYSRETKDSYSQEFQITPFYGNCGICTVSYLKSRNPKTLQLALNTCKAMGYSLVLYSVELSQEQLISDLVEVGFVPLAESLTLNKRSENEIQVYCKKI